MTKYSIRDLPIGGRVVFIRVDFNVPIKDGRIKDDTRITAALPTLKYALDAGATVVLASHLGRPKGKPTAEYSLKPVADHLAALLGRPVRFATDCIGTPAQQCRVPRSIRRSISPPSRRATTAVRRASPGSTGC